MCGLHSLEFARERAEASTSTMASFPLVLALILASIQASTAQPNFIIMMADDISFRNHSFGGGTAQTPFLDKMGENGVNFLRAWSNPICKPTRAMLMTGEYAMKTEWWSQSTTPTNLGKEFGTFGNLAKANGYRTLMVGKYQLFRDGTLADHGFDKYCMWEKSDVESTTSLRNRFEEEAGGPTMEERGGKRQQNRFWHPLVVRNLEPNSHEMLITTPNDFGPNIMAQCVKDFIEQDPDTPFLVYWAGLIAHKGYVPEAGANLWNGMPTGQGRNILSITGREPVGTGTLKSNIEYVDRIAGFLQGLVRRAGLAENTVFFYTADNGSQTFGKGSLSSEEGVHVPLVVWGGPIKKRGSVGKLISLVDIYNTVADMMGVGVDVARRNSYSFADFLTGKSGKHVRKWMIATLTLNDVIEGISIRSRSYILDNDDRFWNCSKLRDERTCDEISDATGLSIYGRMFSKRAEVRSQGYADARTL
mmetsp:Transcript_16399/g.40408  ORF Transcript_16399/g.40408 Transcript_16399/m.40408 type:complete len:476 (+) Transcript_16399:194-1621(+)